MARERIQNSFSFVATQKQLCITHEHLSTKELLHALWRVRTTLQGPQRLRKHFCMKWTTCNIVSSVCRQLDKDWTSSSNVFFNQFYEDLVKVSTSFLRLRSCKETPNLSTFIFLHLTPSSTSNSPMTPCVCTSAWPKPSHSGSH